MNGVFGCVSVRKLFSCFREVCLFQLLYFPVVYFRFTNVEISIIDSKVHKFALTF